MGVKVVVKIISVACGLIAAVGMLSVALGFAFIAASLWIQERMED